MPRVNRFYRLPIEVQREVDAKLATNGFSDYVAIADELKRRGYRISKSALHRHGQALKKACGLAPEKRYLTLDATEQLVGRDHEAAAG